MINYGRQLYDAGQTQDQLTYTPAAELERRLDEMEEKVLAEAEVA